MEQVEIFESSDDGYLQKKVNDWLKEHKDKIEVTQRLLASSTLANNIHLTLAIFYKTKV